LIYSLAARVRARDFACAGRRTFPGGYVVLLKISRILILLVLAAAAVGAQRGDAGGSGAPPMNPDPTPFDEFVTKLKLDGRQLTEIQNILNAAATEAAPVSTELLQIREKLMAAEVAGKADEMSGLLTSYTTTAAKMTALEVKAFKKVQGVLKEGQLKKSAEAFSLIAGLFNQPTRARGGRRPGGGL
jgi:hypothetical protein